MQIPVSAAQAVDLHPVCAQKVLDQLNSKLAKAGKALVDAQAVAWAYEVMQAIARDTTLCIVVVVLRGKVGRRVVEAHVGQFAMDTLPKPVAEYLAHTPLPAVYPPHVATLHTKDRIAIYRHLVYAGFIHRHTVHVVCASVHMPTTLALWALPPKGARNLGPVDAAVKDSLMAVEPGGTWAWQGRFTTAQVTRLADADLRAAVGEDARTILGFLD
jgi:hypothetical protein